jgi:hypothetical protein
MQTTKITTINNIKCQHVAIEKNDTRPEISAAFNAEADLVLVFDKDDSDLMQFAHYFAADGIEIDMAAVTTIIERQYN